MVIEIMIMPWVQQVPSKTNTNKYHTISAIAFHSLIAQRDDCPRTVVARGVECHLSAKSQNRIRGTARNHLHRS